MSEHEHERPVGRRASDFTEQRAGVERHLQTLFGIIIIGVMGWVGLQVTEQQRLIAGMTVEQRNLKEDVNEIKHELRSDIRDIKNDLRSITNDKITATEVEKGLDGCRARISILEDRVRVLEGEPSHVH